MFCCMHEYVLFTTVTFDWEDKNGLYAVEKTEVPSAARQAV